MYMESAKTAQSTEQQQQKKQKSENPQNLCSICDSFISVSNRCTINSGISCRRDSKCSIWRRWQQLHRPCFLTFLVWFFSAMPCYCPPAYTCLFSVDYCTYRSEAYIILPQFILHCSEMGGVPKQIFHSCCLPLAMQGWNIIYITFHANAGLLLNFSFLIQSMKLISYHFCSDYKSQINGSKSKV